jgi:hypothetical protein
MLVVSKKTKGEVGKEVLPPFEDLLFHGVLQAAGGLLRELLAEPCHRPIKVAERNIFYPLDPIVILPFVGRAVGARLCETVGDSGEDGPFEGELELAAEKKIIENPLYAELVPETAEDEGYADLRILRWRCLSFPIGIEKGEPFREPRAGAKEAVNGAAFFEDIDPADGPDDLLLYLSFLSPDADNSDFCPETRINKWVNWQTWGKSVEDGPQLSAERR